MAGGSHFRKDIQQEQILGQYLDGLYDQLGMSFERMYDKEMQNSGVDIIITPNGKRFLVDEKAQLDYINKSIPTFAFEIGGFKDAQHKPGWLFDAKKQTTHYLLITDIYLKQGERLTRPEDIASLSLLWINRQSLLDFLKMNGIDKARCEEEELYAREMNINGKIPTGIQGLYFYLSGQKAEAPFNIIIARNYLLQIGKQVYPSLSA